MNISCILSSLNFMNLSDIRVHIAKLHSIKYQPRKNINNVFIIIIINHHHIISAFTPVWINVNNNNHNQRYLINFFKENNLLKRRYNVGMAADTNTQIKIFRLSRALNIST